MQITTKAERAVKRRPAQLCNKQMTDQSYKKSCDINNIVKQFAKTGILPNSTKIPQFGDFSNIPTMEEAFNMAQLAQEAFYGLPADLRKELDNDPSRLESYIADANNYESCVKHGLIEKKQEAPRPMKVEVVNPEGGHMAAPEAPTS